MLECTLYSLLRVLASVAMASLIDSTAAFNHRLQELRFSANESEALRKQDISTFGELAFAASSQPGQIDDNMFADLVKTCFGVEDASAASLGLRSKLRRVV